MDVCDNLENGKLDDNDRRILTFDDEEDSQEQQWQNENNKLQACLIEADVMDLFLDQIAFRTVWVRHQDTKPVCSKDLEEHLREPQCQQSNINSSFNSPIFSMIVDGRLSSSSFVKV